MREITNENKGILIASLIKEIYLKLNNNISSEFKESGLTLPQLMLVRVLARHRSLPVTELSSALHLTKGTVSTIIDRMEKQEIIKRVRSKEDKRVVYVELDEKGRELAMGMKDTMNEYFDGIFSKCTEEQMNTVLEGLGILKGIVDELDATIIDH